MYIDDDFWDIASLTPPKNRNSFVGRNSSSDRKKKNTETTLLDIGAKKSSGQMNIQSKKVQQKGTQEGTFCPYEYIPDNKLIFSVKVAVWPSQYTFYERFEQDAVQFLDKSFGECEYIPFFSFMPQYSQMTGEQLKYYFWWRENVREGRYLKTDFCYLQLFIYEVINLPTKIPPENGIQMLCGIWANYRDKYPKLDKYLSEWVCDYCLTNKVTLPIDKIMHFLDDIMKHTSFKEFYLSASKGGNAYAIAVLELSSGYNYRKSKYMNAANRKLFQTHIQGAILAFAEKMAATDTRFNLCTTEIDPIHVARDTYIGAICSYKIKRRLTIKYVPITRSSELHFYITDAIKLSENYVRAHLGIKSRFATPHLTKSMRFVIGEYFEHNLPSTAAHVSYEKTKSELEVQAYERLYESENNNISIDSAKEIEKQSREIIKKLTPAFENEEETQVKEESAAELQVKNERDSKAFKGKSNELVLLAIKHIINGDNVAFASLAKAENILTDTLVERVNEAAIDEIGDIAVEFDGNNYTIISDYKEDILEWMNR